MTATRPASKTKIGDAHTPLYQNGEEGISDIGLAERLSYIIIPPKPFESFPERNRWKKNPS
jgi:hypothetical protein